MAYDTAPAIRRQFGEQDREAEVIEQVGKKVHYHHRGLGETGTRVQKVQYDEGVEYSVETREGVLDRNEQTDESLTKDHGDDQ